jgi:hypothetical protein
MPESIHRRIERERDAATARAKKLRTFRRYARGRHKETLSGHQKRVLRSLVGHLFCDNVVGRVLGELRDRLRLARFEVGGTGGGRIESYLSTLWTKNHLPRLSADTHWATFRDGNHGVGLAWSDEADRVVLTRELWWNGDTGLFIAYGPLGQARYAVKEFYEGGGRKRRTIYYPARIERYRLDGRGWKPHQLEGDDGWPVNWTTTGTASGDPIGLPFVHFSHTGRGPQDPANPKPRTSTTPRSGARGEANRAARTESRRVDPNQPDPNYGASELDGGVIGLQDEINDVQRDITSSARFTAYQMYYGTGLTPPPEDEEGGGGFTVEPGSFLEDPNADADIGVLQAGSIEPLKQTLKTKLEAISRATAVPMFAIQGDWPSGEALIRAEQPLIEKVRTAAKSIGPAWGSVAHKATRLRNIFGAGGGALDEDLMIQSIFAPVARRDPLTRGQIAESRAEYVSHREVLRILGYGPQKIEQIIEEREEERDPVEQERRQLALDASRRAADAAAGAAERRREIEERATSQNGEVAA